MSKQLPFNPFIETALHYHQDQLVNTHQHSRIAFSEINNIMIHSLRSNQYKGALFDAFKEIMLMDIPVKPRTMSQSDHGKVYWISPDEWLIVTKLSSYSPIARLSETLSDHFALVDITGGMTGVQLSGEKSIDLLKKSTMYDFRPTHFFKNSCVQTKFASANALICKINEFKFDLYFRRSFADYLIEWCLDACKEYTLRQGDDYIVD